MRDILLLNGHLVDPAAGIDAPRDLLLRGGLVAAVETPGTLRDVQDAETIDASGLVVAPGLVDIHVHLREPGQTYKETIATGTAAAAARGFTTVVAMPNTVPVNDSIATTQWIQNADRGAAVNLFCMPAATVGSMGGTLTDFETLRDVGGAVGFTDDGKPILDAAVMRSALIAAARCGVPISQHAEDTRLTGGCSMNAGPVAFRLGLRGMPIEAEAGIVERDIALLREIEISEGLQPHLHVQHVSTARALQAIRDARREGLRVTCEVAPHHFTLTENAVGDYDTNAKMNPPLRSESDRLAVIEAILDGTVDCLASDHAPHARHEKEVEFERAPNGITGLDTALGLALLVLHREHGMPLAKIVTLMSTNPAALVLPKEYGALTRGSRADLVIFNASKEWHYDVASTRSKSRNTPFGGALMLGRVHSTTCGGDIVFRQRD